MFEISNLEIHAWHGCNLACESCAHYSSLGFGGRPNCGDMRELDGVVGRQASPPQIFGSGKNVSSHAAFSRSRLAVSRPSRTAARTVATRCAPRGDQRIRRRFAILAFAISSTQPSARDVDIGLSAR